MAHLHAGERLTAEDAAFLYLEKEEMPLHIGSVSVFEGVIPFESLVEYVASRLPLIPRYRQRLVEPPLHIGHPTWEADPEFKVQNHVHLETLARGTETELRELAGRIFSRVMDRNQPLWDLTLVHGLRGRRCGLIARVHHCLADGVSGAGLMNVMLNADGCAPAADPQGAPFEPPPLPRPETSVLDALASAWSEAVERMVSAQSVALDVAQALLSDRALRSLDQLLRLAPELLTPVQPLPFNRALAGPRRVAWAEISIPEVKAIRELCGGTLNDVALTTITGAIRRYARLHGVPLKHRLLRVMVPVSLRKSHETGTGNRVSMLPVSIPLDVADPRKLLNLVRQRTETLKNSRVADLIALWASWVGSTPAPIQAMLGPVAALLPMPPFNLVCTNVPGPQFPLYALGHQMLTYHPYVPIGSEMGVGIAMQSYNQKLYFGLTGDVDAAPDLDRLKKFMDDSFAALRKAAGVMPAHKPRRARARAAEFPVSAAAAAD